MQTEINYDIVFDAQQHFRLLLDSMSRPGKINSFPVIDILPPEGLSQAAALVGFALLNSDVTCFIAGDKVNDVSGYFLVNTGTQHAEISMADYIFLPENYYADDLSEARIGVPTYPEDSATLVALAGHVDEHPFEGSWQITLKGPGVNGESIVYVSGINPLLLDFIKEQNSEYPLGLDLIIADRGNQILCIPRSNTISFSQTGQE